jgi:molybdate/tungstate transport system permease protein
VKLGEQDSMMQQTISKREDRTSWIQHNKSRLGLILWFLGICLLLYLVSPLIYFLFSLQWPIVPTALSDPEALQSLSTSLISATAATLLMGLFGIPLGYLLARYTFPGKNLVNIAIYIPLVFPPVISGIILLVLYGPYGLIGGPLTTAGLELDNTTVGIILAQIFVASPFVIVSARSAFETIDPKLEQVAATLGQNRWQLFWRVSLPLARGGVISGLILAWMRALGEFGATVVMAYHPYTLPVYTYVQLTGIGVPETLPLALYALAISASVIGLIFILQRHLGGQVHL